MKIFTHVSPDLDAVCSVWALRKFVAGFRKATVEFRPANWDGEGMTEGDVALDIEAGGRGLKGKKDADGTVHSCFASVVGNFATPEDREALAPIVRFVDAQDAYGSAFKHLVPGASREAREVFARTGLNAVLRSFQSAHHGNDSMVMSRMSEVLDGMLRSGRSRIRAAKEADNAELFGGGKVAIVRNNREFSTNGVLFEERGVQVIVYVDGHNLGLIRDNAVTVRMDHDYVRAVVALMGELAEWFAHPAGFLFCRGSRKSPATDMSKVDPRALAEAILRLL